MNGYDLIRKADRVLYEAKEKGKSRLCVWVITSGRLIIKGGCREIKY